MAGCVHGVSIRNDFDFARFAVGCCKHCGNSGCGLRFPDAGDPAFDGLELQMCDPRYYGDDAPKIPLSELTGSLYRAIAPSAQVYKPEDWNKYEIKLVGQKVNVKLNAT